MKTPIITVLTTVVMSIASLFNSAEAKTYRAENTNEAGQPITITISKGHDDQHISPQKQYRFAYDNGMLSEKMIYQWNSETKEWIETGKYQYEYNSSNQLITQVYTEWNKGKKDWDGTLQQMIYLYNIDGELLTVNYLNTDKSKDYRIDNQYLTLK